MVQHDFNHVHVCFKDRYPVLDIEKKPYPLKAFTKVC